MEFSWFFYSVAATTLFGIGSAIHKLPVERGESKALASFWSILTAFVLSLMLFNSYLASTSNLMIILALIFGISFAILRLLHMSILKHLETNVIFPINTTVSLVILVLVGLVVFNETVSLIQGLGIILVVVVISLFMNKGGKIKDHWRLILMAAATILASVAVKVSYKLGADLVDIHSLQIYQYGFAVLFSLIILLGRHAKKGRGSAFFGGSMRVGIAIGLFSFFGGYALLIALAKGPFSLIISIHSLYILVTAILGYLLFKEKVTKKKIFLILASILAILFIRLG